MTIQQHPYRDPGLESAARALVASRAVVVLTGAGVSAESGVPTFRDAQTGLWAHYDPETLATPQGFAARPGLVWRWYMSRFGAVRKALPNEGHAALAGLESWLTGRGQGSGARRSESSRFSLFTQNIDDLHERAGSVAVHHLHGNLARFRCSLCSSPHDLAEEDWAASEPPHCERCDGLIRPDVVWFGEILPERILAMADRDARECNVMIVVGTSGQVFPVALLPPLAKQSGAFVIDVNTEYGPMAALSDVHLHGPSALMLPALLAEAHHLEAGAP